MRAKGLVLFISFPLLGGCAYYQSTGASSAPAGSQYERPVGIAEGKASGWNFFPCYSLCQSGDASLEAAVRNALDGQVGDALTNVYVERKTVAFPHIYLPLVTRTEVRVMGTLVKYNTKEFPPDRDHVYSGIPGEMWSQLVSFEKPERARYSKGLSDRNRSVLVDFALYKENEGLIEAGSRDSDVFAMLLLRDPRTVTPRSVLKAEASIDLRKCNSYECIITLSPEKQAEALKLVGDSDRSVRAELLDSARKRIKACYPHKVPPVVTSPEVQLIYNESILLETLCKAGELRG
ncbi:MAG TPA: hypothetical protein PL037_08905 [Elusimicrobiales bacterium]|nr:hypothetical protein [Elusimicrobiales bacterium]